MKATTVQELINALEQVKDKTLPVRILPDFFIGDDDAENIWLESIECSDKGQSGYELSGEVRLIGGV